MFCKKIIAIFLFTTIQIAVTVEVTIYNFWDFLESVQWLINWLISSDKIVAFMWLISIFNTR